MPSNPWSAVDNAVLEVFLDGQPRITRDVHRLLPDLTLREVAMSLDENAQHGWLAAGEMTYVITEAGQRHLTDTKAMA